MANFVEQATLTVKDNSSSQINKINKALKDLFSTAKSLKSATINIKVSETGVKNAISQVKALSKELNALKGAAKTINIGVNTGKLTGAARAVSSLTKNLEALRAQGAVTIRVSAPGLQQVKSQLAGLRQSARAAGGGRAATALAAPSPLSRAQAFQTGRRPPGGLPAAPAPHTATAGTGSGTGTKTRTPRATVPQVAPASNPASVAHGTGTPTGTTTARGSMPRIGAGHTGMTGGAAFGVGSSIGGGIGGIIKSIDQLNPAFYALAGAARLATEALQGIYSASEKSSRADLRVAAMATPKQQEIINQTKRPEGLGPISLTDAERRSQVAGLMGDVSKTSAEGLTGKARAAQNVNAYLEKEVFPRIYAASGGSREQAIAGSKVIAQAINMSSDELTDNQGLMTPHAKRVANAMTNAIIIDPDMTPQLMKATLSGAKTAPFSMNEESLTTLLLTAGNKGSKSGNQMYQAIKAMSGNINNVGLANRLRDLGLYTGFKTSKKGNVVPGTGQIVEEDLMRSNFPMWANRHIKDEMDKQLIAQGKDPKDQAAQQGWLEKTFSMARETATNMINELIQGAKVIAHAREQYQELKGTDINAVAAKNWAAQIDNVKVAATDAAAKMGSMAAEFTNAAGGLKALAEGIREHPGAAVGVAGGTLAGGALAIGKTLLAPAAALNGSAGALNQSAGALTRAAGFIMGRGGAAGAAGAGAAGAAAGAAGAAGAAARRNAPQWGIVGRAGARFAGSVGGGMILGGAGGIAGSIGGSALGGAIGERFGNRAAGEFWGGVAGGIAGAAFPAATLGAALVAAAVRAAGDTSNRLSEKEAKAKGLEGGGFLDKSPEEQDRLRKLRTVEQEIASVKGKIAAVEATRAAAGSDLGMGGAEGGNQAELTGALDRLNARLGELTGQLGPLVRSIETKAIPSMLKDPLKTPWSGQPLTGGASYAGKDAMTGGFPFKPGLTPNKPFSPDATKGVVPVKVIQWPIGPTATGAGGVAMGTPGAVPAPTGGIKPIGPAGWGMGTDPGLSIQTAAKTMLDSAAPYTAAATAFQQAGPTFQASMTAGAQTLTTAGEGIKSSIAEVGPTLTAAGTAAGAAITTAGQGLSTSLQSVGPMLSQAGQAAGAAMTTAASTFSSTFATAAATLSTAGATAAAALSGAAPGIGAAIGNAAAASIRSSVSSMSISVNANVKSTSSGSDTGAQKAD